MPSKYQWTWSDDLCHAHFKLARSRGWLPDQWRIRPEGERFVVEYQAVDEDCQPYWRVHYRGSYEDAQTVLAARQAGYQGEIDT